MTSRETALGEVVVELIRHPVRSLVSGWNWKSSLVSSACLAVIFLLTNLPAGLQPGFQAMLTEFVFRGIASGVFGSMTQAFSRARPPALSNAVALIGLPVLSHTAEFIVHRAAGTPRLGASMAVSIGFSVLTTAFNLFAMRRGALIVGAGQRPLAEDLRRIPVLLLDFAASLAVPIVRPQGRRGGNKDACLS